MKKLLTLLLITTLVSCDNSCKKNIDYKFKKGDEVQIKSSRWAKKGVIVDREINSDCECVYEVSQTTWIEGRRTRLYSEYEIEAIGSGIDLDAEKIIKLIK